jgi:hypothetical protein
MKILAIIITLSCLLSMPSKAQYYAKLGYTQHAPNRITISSINVLSSNYNNASDKLNNILSHTFLSAVKIKNNMIFEFEIGPIQNESYNISNFILLDSGIVKDINLKALNNAFSTKLMLSKIVMGTNASKKMFLALGGGLQYIYSNSGAVALDSFSKQFATLFKNNSFNTLFCPQLYYNFNTTLSTSLSFPINFVSVSFVQVAHQNESIAVNQRNISFTEFKILPGDFVNINLSLMLKIK